MMENSETKFVQSSDIASLHLLRLSRNAWGNNADSSISATNSDSQDNLNISL